LALEALSPAAFDFIIQVEQAYTRLIETARADRETGLGGTLFYAGEMDAESRALIAAANIAGTATLTATADRDAQKQAIRDGIADFLVNSLDEALRILKNELRKRESVAVCVGLAANAVEREMAERGVLPDLQRPDLPKMRVYDARMEETPGVEGGARAGLDSTETKSLVTWSVASAPAQWLPVLDAIALDCLDEDAWRARRWLRLAPRFLGRLAQGIRLISADREFAPRFIRRVRVKVERGEITVAVEIRSQYRRMEYVHRIVPEEAAGGA
jgi:hypothetical protein